METYPDEVAVSRKVYRRLMWFLVLLFTCSYLDRINTAFAALSMNKDLGLTATTFGIASSMFYAFYIVAEIPSNMAMNRVGARLWIPRIMITWGLASMACIFAIGPKSLYFLRALVGLAEAGFMPGVLLYMTYWFPESYRARASTLFIMAQPITILFGSTFSGAMLQMDGVLNLRGWQWLFLLQAAPSVILGIVAYFYLSNRPADATWLTAREKDALRSAIERGEKQSTSSNRAQALANMSVGRQLLQLPVILLGLCYFGQVMSLVTNSTWVPQIVRSVVPHASLFRIGLVTAIPSLVAIIVMTLWGKHSDRQQERAWHVIIPMIVAAIGWVGVAIGDDPVLRFVSLILCSVGTFSAQGVFWTLAPRYLSPSARAVGIGFVNVVGMLGTALGPAAVGILHDRTHGFGAGLLFVAACVFAGALCVVCIRHADRSRNRDGALASLY